MATTLRNRLINYCVLMRFDKPIGIFLLLWPTLWALWIAAGGVPPLKILGVFIAGVIIMRAAGCVINDFADRKFDGKVGRTKNRPLATGATSSLEALILFAVLMIIALVLVLQLNQFAIYLALAAAFLAIIYPFMKRFISLPQLVLGLAFAWSVPMAFAAVQNHVPWSGWLIFLITVLWTVAYDTQYAMVDRADDIKIGLKSTAILFGKFDVFIIVILQITMITLLLLLGFLLRLSIWYLMGIIIAMGVTIYQQYLIRERNPTQCFKAFLSNHWLGAAVFIGIVLSNIPVDVKP